MNMPRVPRGKPFLDDAEAYPEFSLLFERRQTLHSARVFLHKHRTATLLTLVALSVAGSGAVMPNLPFQFHWLLSPTGQPRSAGSVQDWIAFLHEGMMVDSLVEHFEGIASAIACVLTISFVSLLVYPLHRRTSPFRGMTAGLKRTLPSPLANLLAGCIAVGLPLAVTWAIAVWGVGEFRWGLASGFCVGLHCGFTTLKMWSYVHSDVVAATASCCAQGVVAGQGPNSNGLQMTQNGDQDTAVDGRKTDVSNGNGTLTATNGSKDATIATAKTTTTISDQNRNITGEVSTGTSINFSEFLFFMVVTPALVCEPRLLKPEARLPPRFFASQAEFFHAALTYLALHTTSSGLFAPLMRTFSAAWNFNGLLSELGGILNLDYDALEQLRASGEGGWLMAVMVDDPKNVPENVLVPLSHEKWNAILSTGAVCTMGFFSPLMHMLSFYAFFHCICFGAAELSGYADRNFYGPWWLAYDHVRDYFRMWSAPVGRWLSVCVQRPLLNVAKRSNSPGHGKKGSTLWSTASVMLVFTFSGFIHECVAYIGMRGTIWPLNTFFLLLAASAFPTWDTIYPVIPERNRNKEASPNRDSLALLPPGDSLKAPPGMSLNGSNSGSGSHGLAAGTIGDHIRKQVKKRDTAVGVYRGLGAVLFCFSTSACLTPMFDFLAWFWWRHAHLSDGSG